MDAELIDLLCCPRDQGAPLEIAEDALTCPTCRTRFPVVDGIVVFLTAQQLSEEEERERTYRGEESAVYDDMYVGYGAARAPASWPSSPTCARSPCGWA